MTDGGAESLYRTPETNTTRYVNCAGMKTKRNKTKTMLN